MKNFLSLVLPTEGAGVYVAWNGANKQHSYYNTLDELAVAIQAIDNSGGVAYYATATFNAPRRLISNVQAKKSLYVDIDFKDLKDIPAEDKPKWTMSTFRAFCKKHSLSPPTFVMSTGGGYHFYWSLEEQVTRDVWQPYADALKAALQADGVPIDPSCTADAARLMRPLETHNRKYTPPYKTEGSVLGKPVPLSHFDSLLGNAPPTLNIPQAASALNMPGQASSSGHKKFWIQSIVESNQCQMMRKALTVEGQTDASESLWSDLLATCSQAEDGAYYAHEFSKLDEARYTTAGVNDKLIAWGGQQHPRTCARFAQHVPNQCGNCQHKTSGSSPIRFGYVAPGYTEDSPSMEYDPSEVVYAMLREQMKKFYPDDDALLVDGYKPPAQWPVGFGFDPVNFRTFTVKEAIDEDGEKVRSISPLWSGVFWPQHKLRDDNGSLQYEFVFWGKRDERPVRLILNQDLYGNRTKIVATLTAYGFPMAGAFDKQATAYFYKALDLLNEKVSDLPMSDAFGWGMNNSIFNFGTAYTTLKDGTVETIPSLISPHAKQYKITLSRKGTVDGWKRAIATYEGPTTAVHRFGLMAGFGSVLMPFTTNGKAHLLHLYSDASGSGKTSLQRAIWSIWAEPNIDAGRATYRAMIDKFGIYGCLPGIVDEITKLDANTLREFAFDVAAGEPRARLSQSGNRMQQGQHWSLIGISSANTDIEYEIVNTGNAEGELARITSLEMPAGALSNSNEQAFRAIDGNYGIAGRLFVEALLKVGIDELKDRLRAKAQELNDAFCRGEQQRAANRFRIDMFSSILIANEITSELGLTNFPERDHLAVIASLMEHSMERLGDPSDNIMNDIKSFIAMKLGGISKLVRQPDGTLALASKLDGFMSRSASRLGNTQQTVFTGESFFVANDWPEQGVTTLKSATRPALYVAKAAMPRVGKQLFPSVRTDPSRTVPPRLAGTDFEMKLVEEAVLGLNTEYYRILLPRTMVANVPEVDEPVQAPTPSQEQAAS